MADLALDTLWTKLDEHLAQQQDALLAFVRELVRTRSANPFTPETSDPDEPIERDVAHRIAEHLSAQGFTPELRGVSAARPNVVAQLVARPDGKPAPKALILNGHMDTVMPSERWQTDPFAAEIMGGKLYGLGVLDMKASLGMMIYAAAAVRDVLAAEGVRLGGDLALAFVVDEEAGACSRFGSAYVLERGLRGTAAIVTEPMHDNVTVGHRGGYRFKLTVHGAAAHTGLAAWERGEVGKNAITGMAAAIRALEGIALPYDVTPAFAGRQPVFTFPTLIQGGAGINIVPETCTAYGDVRLLPGVEAPIIEALIRERLAVVPDLEYTLEQLLFVPAVEIPTDHALVKALVAHTSALTGQTPTTLACGPWNDGWMFITRGIPAICGFGPNGAGAHAPDEYIEIASLFIATRILARAVVDYLGLDIA